MAFHRGMMLKEKDCDDPDSCFYSPPAPSIISPPPLSQDNSSNNHSMSPQMIIIVAVLSATFLLCSYVLILRFCCNWIMSRGAAPQNNNTPDEGDDDDNENQDPIHHVWYITTVGLEESVINSISVCKYNRDEGLIDGTECSVCLGEFRDGDDVRLLPKCSHAFHLPCIDTWLRSHVNCPLCRAGVVSNASNSSPVNPNPDSLDVVGETQMGNSEIDVTLDRNRSCRIERDQQDEEAELDADDRGRNVETGEEMSLPVEDCGLRVQSDLSDNHHSREHAIEMSENVIEPIRRSVSMDSLSASLMRTVTDHFPIDLEGSSSGTVTQSIRNEKSNPVELSMMKKTAPGQNQGILKMLSIYSKGALLQRPVLMKRSFSVGCKFLAPGHGRRRNAVLPL